MAYNVTVIDKSGAHRTVMLAPGLMPEVTNDNFATNHQGTVDWPENASFNQTLERSASLKQTLLLKEVDAEMVLKAFLAPPLYNTRFEEGFGTLYTAEYLPKQGQVNMYWPGDHVSQSFQNFTETYKRIDFSKIISATNHYLGVPDLGSKTPHTTPTDWQETVTESIVNAMARENPSASRQQLDNLRQMIRNRGAVSWKKLMDFWDKPTKRNSESGKA